MEGHICKREKEGEGGCKGVGGKEPGQELGFWRLGGLWAGGLLSRNSQNIFILQNDFDN